MARVPVPVDTDAARRIAIRAQLLDGSAVDVRETVRRLGFLQLDPIATVMTPPELILWSRLGPHDRAELDRLLWEERVLLEWNAFIWPVESLPILRGLMRRQRKSTRYASHRWMRDFMAENRAFRRYVLRELERRGPLLSRELEDRAAGESRDHRWYGSRRVGHMLTILHLWGEIAIAGRRGRQRLWDLADRVYPPGEALGVAEAERLLEEQRFRSLGVRLGKEGWEAHPDALDGPVPDRAVVLSPFDRLVHDRDRAEALFGFHYRLEMYVTPSKREYGYYVIPLLVGDRIAGRVEPLVDRKAGTMKLLGAWGDVSRLDEALDPLATFLGVERV
jgi:uncharacterized protein YcaQ